MSHLLSQIGVGKAKEKQFAQKKIESVEDLLQFYPRRYYDFRVPTPIRNLECGKTQMVYGEIIKKVEGTPAMVKVRDADGDVIQIQFFGTWAFQRLTCGEKLYFGGRVSIYGFLYSMTNPTYISNKPGWIMPVYPKIKGMSDQYLTKSIQEAISFLRANATFDLREQRAYRLGLMGKADAYGQIHRPKSNELYKEARKRIDYERIYSFYEELHQAVRYEDAIQTVPVTTCVQMDQFLASLPFMLTKGQRDAINEIKESMLVGERLNAIVSGDVGCGKTLVAIAASVLTWENSLQAAVMAPTQVLAKQHYEEFSDRLAPLGVRVALLTGETKKKARTELLQKIADGEVDVLIGTQSILSPELKFKALGLTIVDEEHKFGVRQKELISEFDKLGAHHVNMTATPIPRSYAMSVYGDMVQILTIPDMPAGRKVTITRQLTNPETAFEAIYDEIQKGHQAYLVTPFIEESDADQFKDVASVEKMKATATQYYAKNHPGVRIACISGNMKQEKITEVVDAFAAGQYDLLISTTIVEVGVNIPNATVITIIDADRFGLAALHQLRGRVGRKGDQGYCLLVSNRASERLDILCKCHSGFEIAEQDMLLRGPGDLTGNKQAGDESQLVISTILRRPKMSAAIRQMISGD